MHLLAASFSSQTSCIHGKKDSGTVIDRRSSQARLKTCSQGGKENTYTHSVLTCVVAHGAVNNVQWHVHNEHQVVEGRRPQDVEYNLLKPLHAALARASLVRMTEITHHQRPHML
jgi:hypothetical protein